MTDHGSYPTFHAERALIGHCPLCGRVLVVLNDRESWPLVACPCGQHWPTTALVNRVRLDRDFLVSDAEGERVERF